MLFQLIRKNALGDVLVPLWKFEKKEQKTTTTSGKKIMVCSMIQSDLELVQVISMHKNVNLKLFSIILCLKKMSAPILPPLKALRPRRPSRPGGPLDLEALQAWRPLGPKGPLGLEACQACHYQPPSELPSFRLDQKVVSTLFPTF